MNYLETLSDNERFIVSEIINEWNKMSISLTDEDIPSYDRLGIHLYDLLNRLMLKNTIQTKSIDYQIDIESGQINIYLFFDAKYVKEFLGQDYRDKLKDVVAQQIRVFIIGINFIIKLYEDGLIYFPNENFEESKFEDWYVPIKEYPKPDYIWEFSYFFSKKIAKFLDLFLPSSISPSFQLIELYEQEFKTIEARRYEEQQGINTLALKRAKYANIIAIIIAIMSMIVSVLCAVTIPVSINNKQHNELIEIIKISNTADSICDKP